MEIGGGDISSASSAKEGRIASDENDNDIGLETLGEGEEGDFELQQNDYKNVEVKKECWHYYTPVGKVLQLADALHKLSTNRLKHAVWSTVKFSNADKYSKGILSCPQFITMMTDSKPKRTRDELEQLYSDLVYASDGGLMTYGTFRMNTLSLCETGFLEIEEMTSDELLESAHSMSVYYREKVGRGSFVGVHK